MTHTSLGEVVTRRGGRGFAVTELGGLLASASPDEGRKWVTPFCLLLFADEGFAERAHSETWGEVGMTGAFEELEPTRTLPPVGNDLVRQRGLWVFPLPPGRQTWVIGRDPTCDVVLFHSQISRRHAELSEDAAGLFITDLASRNGTTKDGEALPPSVRTSLGVGETFVIGSSRLAPQATEVIQELARRLS